MQTRTITQKILEERGFVFDPDGNIASHRTAAPSKDTRSSAGTKTPKKKLRTGPSKLAKSFLYTWELFGGPELTQEMRFHPTRKWRFDFALPEKLIAIEIDGGVFTNGRHTRGKGFVGDCEKLNAAAALGWQVFRLASGMVKGQRVEEIINFAKARANVAAAPCSHPPPPKIRPTKQPKT